MKTLLSLCFMAFTLTLAGVHAFSTPVHTPEESAVRATLLAQETAWNSGDLEGFLDGFVRDESLVFYSPTEARQGFDTIAELYRARYADHPADMGRARFSGLHVSALGPEAALAYGNWTWTVKGHDVQKGLVTLVMKKTDDGWKVGHYHLSLC